MGRGRAALLAAGLALGALALGWMALRTGSVAGQAPDPFAPGSDPWGGHPDTWAEVAAGVVGTLALAGVAGGALAGAVALAFRAAGRETPRWSRMVAIPLGAMGVAAVALAVAIVPLLGDARRLPDCDTFAFREADWRAGGDRHLATAWGIANCGTFTDATRATVLRRLGKPERQGTLGDRYYFAYDGLALIFAGDRLEEARAGATEAS